MKYARTGMIHNIHFWQIAPVILYVASYLQAQCHEQLSLQANSILRDEFRHFEMTRNISDCVQHEPETCGHHAYEQANTRDRHRIQRTVFLERVNHFDAL